MEKRLITTHRTRNGETSDQRVQDENRTKGLSENKFKRDGSGGFGRVHFHLVDFSMEMRRFYNQVVN